MPVGEGRNILLDRKRNKNSKKWRNRRMLKKEIAIIGLGLAGQTVAYGFQKKNYPTYLINGSAQDNSTLSGAKNVLVLDGYDGLAGQREFAYEALKNNKTILRKISQIEQKIVVCIASGGGSTGSGSIPLICDILAADPEKVIVPILLMPRRDEPIQKRLNAYNVAKEISETEGIGATIFVNNESYDSLQQINSRLISMLDAFFTDNSHSLGANFDDSEKEKMLKDKGAFVIAMLSDKNTDTQAVSTEDMIQSLTAKNIFLPINNDGVVSNIGIINQGRNKMDEHEIVNAVGTPENIFVGYNGSVNIACLSGLSYPIEYIKNLGESAITEQKQRMDRRKSLSLLDDLEEVAEPVVAVSEKKSASKRKRITLDMLRE